MVKFHAFYLLAPIRGNFMARIISMIWRVLSHVEIIRGWFSLPGGGMHKMFGLALA